MKNLYVSLLASDNYVEGIIGLNYSLKLSNALYPFKVMITDNVSSSVIKRIEENNIDYIVIPSLYFKNNKNERFSCTINKFYFYNLLEYDKICFLDADILVLDNIDYFFNYQNNTCAYKIEDNEKKASGGVIISSPQENFFNIIVKKYSKKKSDEEILEELNISLILNKDYFKIFHHGGAQKYWFTIKEITLDNISKLIQKHKKSYLNIQNKKHTLEFIVSSQCNLNCGNCDHFAPIAPKYFETIESIKNKVKKIKNSNIKVEKIILIGGEPLLNKELGNITKIFLKEFNVQVEIFTNGILIQQIKEEDLQVYKNDKVIFKITPYPINCNYEEIEYFLKQNKINYAFLSSRFVFGRYIPNFEGKEEAKENFYHCGRFNLPVLTIYDDKIYYCPFAYGSQFININEEKNDYLKLDILNPISLDEFENTPKNKCKYCSKQMDAVLWYKSIDSYKEFTNNLKSLYLNDYDLYNKIFIDTKERIEKFLSNSFLTNNIDIDYKKDTTFKTIIRHKLSKIDIIIPFYNINEEVLNSLEKTLCEQSIIDDCIIYLISDNSPYEEMVFDKFFNHKYLNCYLLKNKKREGPGVARNIGLNNSFGKYVYFLDVDDEIPGKDILKKLYLKIENEDCISVLGKTQRMINKKIEVVDIPKGIFSREFIENNNIYFPSLFINEDNYFLRKINLLCKQKKYKILSIDDVVYKYNKIENLESITIFHNHIYLCELFTLFYFIQNEGYDQELLDLFFSGNEHFNNFFKKEKMEYEDIIDLFIGIIFLGDKIKIDYSKISVNNPITEEIIKQLKNKIDVAFCLDYFNNIDDSYFEVIYKLIKENNFI